MSGTKTCTHTYCVAQLLLLCAITAAALPNVASHGTATQSSLSSDGVASRAIDGNKNPDYSYYSCTHTTSQSDAWWSLTLPSIYKITAVNITNRDRLAYRLDNAVILIGNSPDNNGNNNPKCADVPSIPASQTYTYQCGGMEGRFVNIYLPGPSRTLTLCEVEVFAELDTPLFSGTVMGRNVAVVEKKLVWSDALIFCRNAFWDLLNVHSQEEQMELENLLSNVSFPLTQHLWLGLHRYLSWDQQASSPCGGMETRSPYQWTDYPCDDHSHFICLTDPKEGVDRVEFYLQTP